MDGVDKVGRVSVCLVEGVRGTVTCRLAKLQHPLKDSNIRYIEIIYFYSCAITVS